MELAYTQNGDYLIPNLTAEEPMEMLGKYGRMRQHYLEQHKPILFQTMLLNGELPQTIGGGIGQSRLCMLMIGNCHIGEVQASIWDAETMKQCEEAGIILL